MTKEEEIGKKIEEAIALFSKDPNEFVKMLESEGELRAGEPEKILHYLNKLNNTDIQFIASLATEHKKFLIDAEMKHLECSDTDEGNRAFDKFLIASAKDFLLWFALNPVKLCRLCYIAYKLIP